MVAHTKCEPIDSGASRANSSTPAATIAVEINYAGDRTDSITRLDPLRLGELLTTSATQFAVRRIR